MLDSKPEMAPVHEQTRVHNQAHFWKVISNFVSLSGGELLARGLTFLSTVYLARVLGTGGFGSWQFALALLGYFMLFADAGFDHFGQREIARDHSRVDSFSGDIIALRLSLAAIAYLALLGVVFLWPQAGKTGGLLVLYGLTLFTMPFTFKWAFWGLERMRTVALANTVQQLLFTLGVFLVVQNPADLNWLPVIQLITEIMIGAGLLAVFYRLTRVSLIKLKVRSWPGLLRGSLPMALSQLMGLIRYNFDVVLLGFVLGEFYVGWYSASYRIITFLMLFVTAYSTALMPSLARCYPDRQQDARQLVAMSLRIMSALTVPIAIGGTLLARPMIELIFGQGYEHSAIAFQFLVWSVMFLSISSSYRLLLRAFNRQNVDVRIVSLAAAVNISLNFLLVLPLGLVGVAVATVAGELVVLGLAYWEVRQLITTVPLLKHLLRPVVAGTVMGLYLILLKDLSLFFLVPSGAIIYFGGLVALHGLTWQEVRFVLKRNRP